MKLEVLASQAGGALIAPALVILLLAADMAKNATSSPSLNIVHDGGKIETLLLVNYNFHWQLSYRLAEPRLLKKGTKLQAVAWFDNSNKNPHNPEPDSKVRWGDQTRDEMMVGSSMWLCRQTWTSPVFSALFRKTTIGLTSKTTWVGNSAWGKHSVSQPSGSKDDVQHILPSRRVCSGHGTGLNIVSC